MQKLIFNVAASVLSVAGVILAQAPNGTAQGPTSPDAVATNLVTTACASCHTLDRVKNKVADREAWTATVTRMKDRGANLTEQQVPVVIEYLTRAASTLPVPAAAAGGGGRGGGGRGGGGRVAPFSAGGAAVVSAANLKVLTAENVEITMQNITFALGLRCIDCHDVTDLSLDTKPQKLKARSMLEMVRDINARWGDGKTHVTCWTCHRGSTQPETPTAHQVGCLRRIASAIDLKGLAPLIEELILACAFNGSFRKRNHVAECLDSSIPNSFEHIFH